MKLKRHFFLHFLASNLFILLNSVNFTINKHVKFFLKSKDFRKRRGKLLNVCTNVHPCLVFTVVYQSVTKL